MMEWIKNHPLMAGGVALLLVVLLLVFRRSSGGGGTQVIQTGPSDALQSASIQAQVQLAAINAGYAAHISDLNAAVSGKKVDAGTALALTSAQKDVALQGILSNQDVANRRASTDLFIAQDQTQGIIQSQSIAANAGVKIAGIQADVLNNQANDQLLAQGIISKATLESMRIRAGVDTHTTDAALEGLKDTNQTNVQIAGISGDTAKTLGTLDATSRDLQTRTIGNIYTDQIDTQGRNVDNYISTQRQIADHNANIVYGLVSSGQINKGGEGGKNQVGFLETWLGNFGGGVANANQTPDTVGTTAMGFTGIAQSIASVFKSIF
jgi:hypothetical protein